MSRERKSVELSSEQWSRLDATAARLGLKSWRTLIGELGHGRLSVEGGNASAVQKAQRRAVSASRRDSEHVATSSDELPLAAPPARRLVRDTDGSPIKGGLLQ